MTGESIWGILESEGVTHGYGCKGTAWEPGRANLFQTCHVSKPQAVPVGYCPLVLFGEGIIYGLSGLIMTLWSHLSVIFCNKVYISVDRVPGRLSSQLPNLIVKVIYNKENFHVICLLGLPVSCVNTLAFSGARHLYSRMISNNHTSY